MEKVIDIIIQVLLIIILCVPVGFGWYKIGVTINQRRNKEALLISENEKPLISEVEECSKGYILDNWLKSGIDLEFITQELIGKNILIYYFKVEPDYFFVDGVGIHYIKAVYKLQDTGKPFCNLWQFDRVMKSNYDEIQTVLEVKNE
jgi:hypothetical protein